mmetsp:Transcript_39652/g.74356  ORF Transcript_39652/g.74356 Transcript_39652/m.74356 type:complete len:97 (+) Transcript_39652:1353-1643(+)
MICKALALSASGSFEVPNWSGHLNLFEKGKYAVHLPFFSGSGSSSTTGKKATKLFDFDKVQILDDPPVSDSSSWQGFTHRFSQKQDGFLLLFASAG